MFWEFILMISIPLSVILLAVFWPEPTAKREAHNSVHEILTRIADEERYGRANYHDRQRD